MTDTNWFKQTKDAPLFPDLQWSRPENKNLAGKLLIVGGEAHSFSVPAEAYAAALDAHVGQVRVALPEQTKKLVPEPMQGMIYFLPGIINGSFAKSSLAELTDLAQWADTVLLAGGFGKNSETVALIERFSHVYDGRLVVSGDSVQAFMLDPAFILNRGHTLLVATIGELQKLAATCSVLVTHDQNLSILVENLQDLSQKSEAIIVTCQNDNVLVACNGKVSSTPGSEHIWRNKAAATAAVWWSQFPDQPFEAITTAVHM